MSRIDFTFDVIVAWGIILFVWFLLLWTSNIGTNERKIYGKRTSLHIFCLTVVEYTAYLSGYVIFAVCLKYLYRIQ